MNEDNMITGGHIAGTGRRPHPGETTRMRDAEGRLWLLTYDGERWTREPVQPAPDVVIVADGIVVGHAQGYTIDSEEGVTIRAEVLEGRLADFVAAMERFPEAAIPGLVCPECSAPVSPGPTCECCGIALLRPLEMAHGAEED